MKIKFISTTAVMLMFSAALIMSCNKKEGCTDPTAVNYDPEAKKNCCCEYAPPPPPPTPQVTILDITKGTTPIQDGVIDSAEWSDAKTVYLYIKNPDQAAGLGISTDKIMSKAYIKHDGQALWIGYEIYDVTMDANKDFADRALVYIDPDYDRAKSPQPDDFFGCVRRMDSTDRYMFQGQGNGNGTGTYADYNTYVLRGAWTAVAAYVPWFDSIQYPNLSGVGTFWQHLRYVPGQLVFYELDGKVYKCIKATADSYAKPTDPNYWQFVKNNPDALKSWSVEWKFPYSDLKITAGTIDTIGVNMNTTDKWTYWPSWINDPSTNPSKQNWIHPNQWGSLYSSDKWQ